MRKVDSTFWKGKKVYLTGHTGFKGSWLSLWLSSLNAKVKGYSLEPPTAPSLFKEARVEELVESQIGDIRDYENLRESIHDFQPDILIHMAAQPLVRLSYREPLETYDTNVMGTAKVLEAAKGTKNLKAIVAITTDKCYENQEWEWGYRENEPMGGYDPYSSSKGACELVISAYQRSYFNDPDGPSLASARAGNVIGGGDWAEDRLIPDILKAFDRNEEVVVRNPQATRPWQHVLEPLSGYLVLAESLYGKGHQFSGAWNFGPKDEDCQNVEWILNQIISRWPSEANWSLDEGANLHEAKFLKLDCSKAAYYLNWQPRWHADVTIDKIVSWHQAWKKGQDMQEKCLEEIRQYNN